MPKKQITQDDRIKELNRKADALETEQRVQDAMRKQMASEIAAKKRRGEL